MQIASQPRSLTDPFIQPHIEFPCHLMEPVSVQPPQQRQTSEAARRLKPLRLIKSRRNHDLRNRAGLIPDAVVIRRDHMKAETTRWKLGVRCEAACSAILPILVVPFQLVAEANAL